MIDDSIGAEGACYEVLAPTHIPWLLRGDDSIWELVFGWRKVYQGSRVQDFPVRSGLVW